MTHQPCNSESRAFIIIDSLTPGCFIWTRKALSRLGSVLAVSLKQPGPVGVAALHSKPGQPSQLQILLRLGASFQAREYLSCIKRLPAGSDASSASDGTVLSGALLALLQHMQKLPARPDCRNHLFILSSSFASCAQHPKMQKVLQLVCLQPGYSLHFLQLTGPETELQPNPLGQQAQHHHHQQSSSGRSDLSDSAFQQMIQGLGSQQNVTFEACVADCEAATDLLCQSWLRELLAPLKHNISHSTSGPIHTPDVLLHFGQQSLPCSLQQYILQLEPWLLPAHLCPCHNLPMLPPSGSTTAAAHAAAAAAAAASDAGSMAALQLLPEEALWNCCITAQPVLQPLSSCRTDNSVMQLGRHTQLRRPPNGSAPAVASLAAGAAQGLGGSSKPGLSLPPGCPCELQTMHAVHLASVDSMLLYGMPMLLCPAASSQPPTKAAAAPVDTGGLSDQALHQQQGHQQGQSSTDQHLQAVTHAESILLMRALCQVLLEQQKVLLVSSRHNLIRRCQQPLQQWYMLQPAADGSCLLLRCMASREQLLPPRHADGTAVGGGVLGGVGNSEQLEEQVILLDAQELESVRASLMSLQDLKGDRSTAREAACDSMSHKQQQQVAANDGQDDSGVAAEAAATGCKVSGTSSCLNREPDGDGAAPAAEGAAEDGTAGSGAGEAAPQPLLLSCGLEEWVSSVLDTSTATYTAPAPAIATALGTTPASATAAAKNMPQHHGHLPRVDPGNNHMAGHGHAAVQLAAQASAGAAGPLMAVTHRAPMPPVPAGLQQQQQQLFQEQQHVVTSGGGLRQLRHHVVGSEAAGGTSTSGPPQATAAPAAGERTGRVTRRNSGAAGATGRKLRLSKV